GPQSPPRRESRGHPRRGRSPRRSVARRRRPRSLRRALGLLLLLLLLDELLLLRLHLLDEVLKGGGLDDLVELRAVVGDEADTLDDDVVDEPAVALLEHPVVDGDFGALLGDDLGPHDGLIAFAGVAPVLA